MAEEHRVAALRAFVDQLNELVELAGSPTLDKLRKLSKSTGVAGLCRELAESTTHDILTGKRKRVPDWEWVSSFVTVCTMAAEQTGLDVQVMGDTQAWHQRWRAARGIRPDSAGTAGIAGTPHAAELSPVATPPPAQQVDARQPHAWQADVRQLDARQAPMEPAPWSAAGRPTVGRLTSPAVIRKPEQQPPTKTAPEPPANTMSEPLTKAMPESLANTMPEPLTRTAPEPLAKTTPEPLPAATQRLLQIYGRIGTRLLRRTDAGSGQDCMRLAVIALLKGWPDEAHHWLRQARDAGQHEASELFNHPHRRRAAAELAYGYGHEYQSTKQPNIAMFFYRLAGDGGHAEAAYQLALIHQRRGEDCAAASWFRLADLCGHIRAGTELDDASERLTQTPWSADDALPPHWLETPSGWSRP
ncbi:hypothetical protein ACIBO2_02715 [Nonomuraea sp. NPDC050022]|uniref:hypothetical protein n=1 Tax=Nonomuraea sp. NPDC050022 TaxID=3364358 RepID=UPI00378CB12C